MADLIMLRPHQEQARKIVEAVHRARLRRQQRRRTRVSAAVGTVVALGLTVIPGALRVGTATAFASDLTYAPASTVAVPAVPAAVKLARGQGPGVRRELPGLTSHASTDRAHSRAAVTAGGSYTAHRQGSAPKPKSTTDGGRKAASAAPAAVKPSVRVTATPKPTSSTKPAPSPTTKPSPAPTQGTDDGVLVSDVVTDVGDLVHDLL